MDAVIIKDKRSNKNPLDLVFDICSKTIGFDLPGASSVWAPAMTPKESEEWHKKHAKIYDDHMIISDDIIND